MWKNLTSLSSKKSANVPEKQECSLSWRAFQGWNSYWVKLKTPSIMSPYRKPHFGSITTVKNPPSSCELAEFILHKWLGLTWKQDQSTGNINTQKCWSFCDQSHYSCNQCWPQNIKRLSVLCLKPWGRTFPLPKSTEESYSSRVFLHTRVKATMTFGSRTFADSWTHHPSASSYSYLISA